jgi:hypothetical protein
MLKKPETIRHRSEFLCHAAFWYGLVFATPMTIALSNQQDLPFQLIFLAAGLAILSIVLVLSSIKFARLLSASHATASVLLAGSLVLAIQGNLIHHLTDFGQFDGSIVNFRKFGNYFWLEWIGFLAIFAILSWAISRKRSAPTWLAWISILSFTLLWLQPAFQLNSRTGSTADIDTSVFEFSSERNLIHLLPDGLQSDVVEEVLRGHPQLAEKFRGFTLFSNHLGMYHGTAPTLPTMLTGKPFDFSRGHTYEWISPFIEQHSYQNQLADQGFELDLVHIDEAYCISRARSCVSRPFSDWKSRGYSRNTPDNLMYSLRLLTDLTLYRLSPAFLKEKIHNQGEWMLADSSMDGASPWPDPVIREWVENMQISAGGPRYKWYHYIGTHKPPFWNANCERQSVLPRTRTHYLGQAKCILEGIALLLEKLESEGIYDQTSIIISGDHGHDIAPADLHDSPQSVELSSEMMGTARPALLIKPMHKREAFHLSNELTSLIDIAEVALNFGDTSQTDPEKGRFFFKYSLDQLASWSGEPVAYDRYLVNGPVQLDSSWELAEIEANRTAPDSYEVISYRTAADFLRGIKLNPNEPEKELAWIDRKQFAFLISLPVSSSASNLIFSLHIPDWIGAQSFTVSVNGNPINAVYEVRSQKPFWQEVTMEIPASTYHSGNDFISIDFKSLHTSPEAPNLKAAALLQSIRIEPDF